MLPSLALAVAPREFVSAKHRLNVRVFLAAITWFACLSWSRPLHLPDEGRYVGVALEMLGSGNWITPTLDGLPFFHKPPLFYWLTALSLDLFGAHAWAARTASLLAASVLLAVFYAALREWLGPRVAGFAALVLATQPLFFGGAQFANMDMLVAACISCSIVFGARAAMRINTRLPYRADLAWAFIAAALGVLAKGLIGAVLPGTVLIVWLGLQGQWRTLAKLCWLPGFAMFAFVVGPWFLEAELLHNGFWHYFFVVQHLERFTGTGFNNAQPFWFYGPVLLALSLPWSLWMLAHLRRWRIAQPVRADVLMLMWVWLATIVGFFSLPASKLVGYVLPAAAPLAALIAMAAAPLLERSQTMARWWKLSTVMALVLCVSPVLFFTIRHQKSSEGLAQHLASVRGANEGVAVIDSFIYDLPFYLRSGSPISIVSDWEPAEIKQHDNWRRELADAGEFAPRLAAERLIDDRRLKTMLCNGSIRWVIGVPAHAAIYPYLNAAGVPWVQDGRALWHTDIALPIFRNALNCEKTP